MEWALNCDFPRHHCFYWTHSGAWQVQIHELGDVFKLAFPQMFFAQHQQYKMWAGRISKQGYCLGNTKTFYDTEINIHSNKVIVGSSEPLRCWCAGWVHRTTTGCARFHYCPTTLHWWPFRPSGILQKLKEMLTQRDTDMASGGQ